MSELIKNQHGTSKTDKKNGRPKIKRDKSGQRKGVSEGRPPIISSKIPAIEQEVVKKLVEAFKIGCAIKEACAYAQISQAVYYIHLKKNPDFQDEINSSKEFLKILARKTIFKCLNQNDRATAMWYLEKKLPEEFGIKSKVDNNLQYLNSEGKLTDPPKSIDIL